MRRSGCAHPQPFICPSAGMRPTIHHAPRANTSVRSTVYTFKLVVSDSQCSLHPPSLFAPRNTIWPKKLYIYNPESHFSCNSTMCSQYCLLYSSTILWGANWSLHLVTQESRTLGGHLSGNLNYLSLPINRGWKSPTPPPRWAPRRPMAIRRTRVRYDRVQFA